ncbi:MAG: hypothetical protein HOQ26_17505 [Gemmatimonadaceae bacterium]|nr:hypothetical protein [Gemmatimonadaceae bacterium]NUQ94698.1 hypothetical protein [Gemmatimonadaceae bacterium]
MTWRQWLSFIYAGAVLVLALAPIVMTRRRADFPAERRHGLHAQAIVLTVFAVVLVLTGGPWDLSGWNMWIFSGYILGLVAALVEYRRAARAKRRAQLETSTPPV